MIKSNLNLKVRRILKSAHLYCTECRVAVLKVLMRAHTPLRQDQIALRLGKNRLNKVTIYRTLESFCRAGLVHKVFMHRRARHFELANHCGEVQCHPHFTCKNCGVTRCLVGIVVPIVKGLKKGFVVHRQQVRLEGLCPTCAALKTRKAS